jgi:hypothetical protein
VVRGELEELTRNRHVPSAAIRALIGRNEDEQDN